jgi:pimeloyl-ACP methyl ester carboxylesterase
MEILEVESPDGTVVACEVVGDGPPLLAVHGTTADRSRWGAVRDQLAERFRLHLMDRRGRGLSAAEAAGYALEREAEDIRALVGAIGEPTLLLVHSYGATCGLAAAVDCPGIARTLAYEPAFGASEAFPTAAVAEMEETLARGDREAALELFFRRALQLDDAAIDGMRGTPLWQARLAAVHTLPREVVAASDFRPGDLRAFGPKLRLLLGTESPAHLHASTRAAHAAAPGSELRDLPGHAHNAMDADPALFVAEVDAWLGATVVAE